MDNLFRQIQIRAGTDTCKIQFASVRHDRSGIGDMHPEQPVRKTDRIIGVGAALVVNRKRNHIRQVLARFIGKRRQGKRRIFQLNPRTRRVRVSQLIPYTETQKQLMRLFRGRFNLKLPHQAAVLASAIGKLFDFRHQRTVLRQNRSAPDPVKQSRPLLLCLSFCANRRKFGFDLLLRTRLYAIRRRTRKINSL